MLDPTIALVVGSQTLIIVALSAILIRTHERLWRVAMSRTPGEYRAAEKDAKRKITPPKSESVGDLDEATALVLASVTQGNPMPHGLGGA